MEYLKITQKESHAVVVMRRPKVNAINFQMVDEMRETFRQLNNNNTIRGVILAGSAEIFSAGLDLIELYHYDEVKIRSFFINFGLLHVELVSFAKPFICAINGHSPAGGTVIAIASDYRVMANEEKFTIGLNEVAVNIQISSSLINSYCFWLGKSLAYRYILEGKLLTPTEALQSNLVSEIAPMKEVLPNAEKQMNRYLKADTTIWCNTKAKMRKSWLDSFAQTNGEKELQQAMNVWWNPEIRKRIETFIQLLKSNKK